MRYFSLNTETHFKRVKFILSHCLVRYEACKPENTFSKLNKYNKE